MSKRRTFPCWSCKEPVSMKARNDADGNCPHCNVELDIEEWPFPSSTSSEHCETCGDYGQVGNILNAEPCPDCSRAVERQEPVEKVDHPNFLEFAICDTCAAESLCCEVAPNEHLCGGCYWAPINEKAHADQVAALQSTIARLEAQLNNAINLDFQRRERITQLESEKEFAAATYQAARDRIAELESGRGEADAWALVNGGGLIRDLTDRWDVAKHWDGDVRSLYFEPPAPVAAVPHGWKLVPIEPTELMIRRGDQNYSWSVANIYKAMIEDAPACLDATAARNGPAK